MPSRFFDTNVLVYIASGDAVKADRAEAIVGDEGVISVQVLNELTNVARREMQMTSPDIHVFLSTFRGLLTVQSLPVDVHETALGFAERYNRSTYDAMIVASARHSDCDILWPEDMQDGMTVGDGLQIVNPFRVIR